jgi:ABC-type uncharacterized transport system involved in gliding motility auxiliary subunit
MNKKKLEAILYSTVGVVAMLILLIGANLIAGVFKQRVDLTADKLYTLSPGTKAILNQLDGTVTIRFYCTRDEQMPVMLKTYAQRVEDLLNEFRQHAKGNLEIQKFNPTPDSDAEDSANLDGVEGQMLQTGDRVYLGLSVRFLDEKVAMPFLSPDREKLMEYDLARAIATVLSTEKAVVGVMTALPVFGQQPNPMMMQMGQMQQQPAWTFISELQRDFTVEPVDTSVESIDDHIKVLLVVHPKDLSENTLYAIDQFILRGGKLVAFLDPMSIMDRSNQHPQFGNMSGGSSLGRLTKAWGVEFENGKVVADMEYSTQISRGQRAESMPTFLSLTSEAVNKDDVITSQIDSLLFPFPGAFSGTPAEGLTKTVLLKSSKNSQLVDSFMAQLSGEQVTKEFKASGTEYALAIRLTGKFKTAFPEGAPKAAPAEAEEDEAKPEPEAAAGLKESAGPTAVTLIADCDFLHDQWSVQVQNILGHRLVTPRNGNLNLVQSVVEELAGDSNLIGSRSRATLSRPFTRVNKLEAAAQASYQEKIRSLEEGLQETQRKLNELQQNKELGQRFIMSPEQQAELARFREREAEAKKELKEVRKRLRQEIVSLENRVKWLNIAGMPLLVTLSGISLAFLKRKRTAAK